MRISINSRKMLFELLSVLIFFNLNRNSWGFVTEALHDSMTEPELAYYFGTVDKDFLPSYEVVYLPTVLASEAITEDGKQDEEFSLKFSAFERPISLRLRRNREMVAPNFKTFLNDGYVSHFVPYTNRNCHYLHQDTFTAAISACNPGSLQGLVFVDNSTLEIHPLTDRLRSLVRLQEPLVEETLSSDFRISNQVPHIIKRAKFDSNLLHNDAFPIADSILPQQNSYLEIEAASHRPVGGLTVELAMFFDEAAYNIFSPFLDHDRQKLQDMILAYLNGVQALYHHPSLGTSLQLVLVRLDLMRKQPSGLPHYDGERSKLLDSFCAYQERLNPKDDSNPDHWDMAVYISGLDFYAYENGRKSGVTMGLATVGGVCLDQYACVIAELGTTNVFGKPYPSAGFTSVYILAHEIGHNLGMHHDSVGNSCPKEGYIMSPSRGTNGETQWSTCSAEVISKLSWAKCLEDSARPTKALDHSRFLDSPGQSYTAKKQCELLLRDKDAVMSPNQELSTICFSLQCKTPHRSGYYFAGPALEGTQCGKKRYCFGGECVQKTPPSPIKVTPGGWSAWKEGQCTSGCIEKSKGFQMKRRFCNNPVPVNTDEGCQGSSVEFGTCKDDKLCKNKRMGVIDYAADRCREFSKKLPELDPKGGGLQAPHEESRVWMGCAIFCRRADSGGFYTPRLELNDLGISPYFPDGTWCHRENNKNYYCLHHHCLPEDFRFSKSSSWHDMGEDVPFSQNAHPLFVVPPELKSYLSLSPDGKPMKTILKPNDLMGQMKEEDWETDDFIEIPELMERYGVRAPEDTDDLEFLA